MIRHIKLLLALATMMVLGIANGTQFPAHYPSNGFDRIGKVDDINFGNRQVIIEDTMYTLSDDVVLNSWSRSSDSLGRLVKGRQVGFDFSGTGGNLYIHEIWLLPSTYTPTEGSIKSPYSPRNY